MASSIDHHARYLSDIQQMEMSFKVARGSIQS